MENKGKIIFGSCILILIVSVLSLIFKTYTFSLTVLSLIQLVAIVVFMKIKLKMKFLSAANIFLLFSYIFHVGQYFLFMFKLTADIPFNIVSLSSYLEMAKALQFYILCQNSIFLGIVIVCLYFPTKKLLSCKALILDDQKNILKIAVILILLGIFPKLYIDISKLKLFLDGGYLNTYAFKSFGFLNVIAHFVEYGILILLYYFSKNKKMSLLLLVAGIMLEIPIILSGNRGWAIICILMYLWLFFKNIIVFKFNIKSIFNVVLILIVLWFLLSIVNFISDNRSFTFDSIKDLLKLYVPYMKKFPLTDILGEFGGTMISLIYIMRFVPVVSPHGCGVGYVAGLLNVFPNIGGFLSNFREEMVFVYALPPEVSFSLGGSYIGELYYNFGYFSIFFALILGIVIGIIFNLLQQMEEENKSLVFPVCICIFATLLWWIRDYFSGIIREIVWVSIFIIIVNLILKWKGRNKFNEKS